MIIFFLKKLLDNKYSEEQDKDNDFVKDEDDDDDDDDDDKPFSKDGDDFNQNDLRLKLMQLMSSEQSPK